MFKITNRANLKMLRLEILILVIVANFWRENFTAAQVIEKPTASDVLERCDTITKPIMDRRSYRGLTLNNGMKVLLVSDPSAIKAAVSMVVGVGSLNDPRGVPGLSGVVVSSLLMGSKKHPDSLDFDEFVRDLGGSLELASELENQYIAIDVNPCFLHSLLTRFIEYFLESLLSIELPVKAMRSAVSLIQQNYLRRKKLDSARIAEVEKLVSMKNHAYSHFQTGNKETLFEHAKDYSFEDRLKVYHSLVEKAMLFHSMWYSSNIMSLTVLGKESLDDLEQMVVPLFREVEKKEVKQLIFPFKFHPCGPEQTRNKIYVVPLADDLRELRLRFSIPDIRHRYKSAPEKYINHLLIEEGPGSLLSILQKRNLCDNLRTEGSFSAGIGFFIIKCALAHGAVDRVDEIITLIFQFINLVREEDIQEPMFNELRYRHRLVFNLARFEEGEIPLVYALKLASDLQNYPFEDILSHSYLLSDWNSEHIRELLDYLRPEYMNVTIVSKSESVTEIAKKEEHYYGVKYEIAKIPDELIETWKTVKPVPQLQLPQVNKFFPKKFDLYPAGPDEPKEPYIIHESRISEIWFKQDDEFNSTTLHVELEIFSMMALNPYHRALWYITIDKYLAPLLKEYFYSATVAGFQIDIKPDNIGILIKLNGFDDTMSLLLEELLTKLNNFERDLSKENFDTILKWLQEFYGSIESNHIVQAYWHVVFSLIEGSWSLNDNLNYAKKALFMGILLSKLVFTTMTDCVIIGHFCISMYLFLCSTIERALEIADIIEKSFNSSKGMLTQEILRPRCAELIDGSHSMYLVTSKTEHFHGYSIYFQFPADTSTHKRVVAALLYAIIFQYCERIRIGQFKNQESAAVCLSVDSHGARGFLFTMQSQRKPDAMDAAVKKFIRSVPTILDTLTDNEFECFKQTLEAKQYAKPKYLAELSARYWFEIKNRYYSFDRTESELEQFRSLKRRDLLLFYREMLDISSPERRILTVHVYPESIVKRKKSVPVDNSITVYEDPTIFRSNVNLLPVSFHP